MGGRVNGTIGQTVAEAEYGMDASPALARQAVSRIRRAEKEYGIQTGVRHGFDEDGSLRTFRVSVSFYPETVFYIAEQMPDGSYGEAREFTEADDPEYGGTFGLKL